MAMKVRPTDDSPFDDPIPPLCTKCVSHKCEHVTASAIMQLPIVDLTREDSALSDVKTNWKYTICYVSTTGEVIQETGFVKAALPATVYRWIAKTYRPKSVTGFFRELKVVEIGEDREEVGPTHKQSLSEQAKSIMAGAKKSTLTNTEFSKIPAFTYKYAGPLYLDEDKTHKFYDVVPHY